VHSRYEQRLTSVSVFECLLPLGCAWAMVVWLRQMIWHARRGQTQQARTARAFALLMAAGALAVMVSAWEAQGRLPTGSFATTYLVTMFLSVRCYHS